MKEVRVSEASPAENRAGGATRRVVMAAVLLLVVALLSVVALKMRSNAQGRAREGSAAPNFALQTFDGETYQLASLRGTVVVVNFWASWCVPCEAEAPELENAWRHYKDQGVLFLGVDYVDTEPEARGFMNRFGITYPNGPDLQTRISQAYRMTGVPETFVIDQQGLVSRVFVGPTTQQDLQAAIDPLLAASR